jgi:retron-type reverse transcriptase
MRIEAPVEEVDKKNGKAARTMVNKDNKRGTPQGSPISPLLSNIHMRLFIKELNCHGYNTLCEVEIVDFADYLVICGLRKTEKAMKNMGELMEWLGLAVNE